MTDPEIVALYWKRSEEAIVCTMQKYGRYLLRLAQNILRLREVAEECVNETYLSAWNQLPPDRPERLLPYLGRISRCLALNRYDYLHAQKRSANLTLSLSELEDCLPAPDPAEQQYESASWPRRSRPFFARRAGRTGSCSCGGIGIAMRSLKSPHGTACGKTPSNHGFCVPADG